MKVIRNEPKNKDPFYYKMIDGKQYSYRYYDSGKEYVVSQVRFLRKRGYEIRLEWLEDEHYIIWRHKGGI